MTNNASDIQEQSSLIQPAGNLFKTALISVAIGGFLGAMARAALFFVFSDWISLILVNILGSFLIGFVMFLPQAAVENRNKNKTGNENKNRNQINFKLFFGTGFLGAFTTFSFFILLPFLTATPDGNLALFEMNFELIAIFFTFALILTAVGIAAVFAGKKAAETIEIRNKGEREK